MGLDQGNRPYGPLENVSLRMVKKGRRNTRRIISLGNFHHHVENDDDVITISVHHSKSTKKMVYV